MSSMSNYLENKLVDWVFRGQSFTLPSALYVALYTSNPTDDAGANAVEVVSSEATGYVRKAVIRSLTTWSGTSTNAGGSASSGTDGKTSNALALTYNGAGSVAWGTVVGFGIYDQAIGGNLLVWGPLTTPRTIAALSDPPQFNVNQLAITFS